jgi:hypothetical protein
VRAGDQVARGSKGGRLTGGLAAWLPLLLLPVTALALVPEHWPAWALMWTLAVGIFAGCKWLTWRAAGAPAAKGARWGRQLAYLFLWPGMDARGFVESGPGDAGLDAGRAPPARVRWGLAHVLVGALLFFGAAPQIADSSSVAAGWVAMVGLVLLLHFGAFELVAGFWQRQGFRATPLMLQPIRSASLAEFWGRRWNTAFRDLTRRHLFGPLLRRTGGAGALWISFLASGLVHDLVISYPAGGGHGGPTLFFLLQAAGMSAERSALGKRVGLGTGGRGRAFTLLCLVVPLPLLFHTPFVEDVIVPFMNAVGVVP